MWKVKIRLGHFTYKYWNWLVKNIYCKRLNFYWNLISLFSLEVNNYIVTSYIRVRVGCVAISLCLGWRRITWALAWCAVWQYHFAWGGGGSPEPCPGVLCGNITLLGVEEDHLSPALVCCVAISLCLGWRRITWACRANSAILPHSTPDTGSFVIVIVVTNIVTRRTIKA